MRVAFLGTRGIPARYGGFESCVEEISTRLAERGHDVTVYCRSDYPKREAKQYRGVRLIQIPRLQDSFLASPFNSWLVTVHATLSRAQILQYFGCGNVPFTMLARVMGKRVILTVDGIEWKRSSYSRCARMYLRSFAELAMVFPDVTVADSASSQEWYERRTGVCPTYIPYGIKINPRTDDSILNEFGLEKGKYVVFAGRLVQEKGAHNLIEAFKSVRGDSKLVVIGDSPKGDGYVDELKRSADSRTVFLGYVYGAEFEAIRNGAAVYVHPSLLDGTSIALLGAMGGGVCVLSSNLRENIDVAGEAATYYSLNNPQDLAEKLQSLLDDPGKAKLMGEKALHRASKMHNWEKITDTYEEIYQGLLEESRIRPQVE
jgi:glycosyltransferase involved in cell wall biosynthesis